MKIDADRITDAFSLVTENYRAPQLNGKTHHAALLRDAAYIITRDTLVHLDVNFKRAEKLARDHAGCARERLQRCLDHLR